jgi:hypothetical protein
VTFLHCSLSHDSNLFILPKSLLCLLYISLSTNIDELLITIHPKYISNYNSGARYIKNMVKHCRSVSYVLFTSLFLLVSIAWTVINTYPACLCDIHVGQTNPGTYGEVLISWCSGHCRCLMPLSRSLSDSTSATQSSMLWFGQSKSPFQLGQWSVSEMLVGLITSALSTGGQLILRIQRTCNIWVHPPGLTFADKAGDKGDLSDNLNAAAPSCGKNHQDGFKNSSVFERFLQRTSTCFHCVTSLG